MIANTNSTVNESQQQVEELGVSMEAFGRTPVESRVFAYLLLAEPRYCSFDEIREFLSASKGAVSSALNVFIKEGTVTYKTFNGDRKRYFMIDVKGWNATLMKSAANLTAFNTVFEKVIEHRKDGEEQDFVEELQSLLDFQIYLSEGVQRLLDEWKTK